MQCKTEFIKQVFPSLLRPHTPKPYLNSKNFRNKIMHRIRYSLKTHLNEEKSDSKSLKRLEIVFIFCYFFEFLYVKYVKLHFFSLFSFLFLFSFTFLFCNFLCFFISLIDRISCFLLKLI